MPHAALCVSRLQSKSLPSLFLWRFNAARSIVCVETETVNDDYYKLKFQCRTQHCVCRDEKQCDRQSHRNSVSMPHAALCVSRRVIYVTSGPAAEAFQCRTQHCVCRDCRSDRTATLYRWFQCRTQHCVCRDAIGRFGIITPLLVSMPHAALCVSRHWEQAHRDADWGFNAARSIVCVETSGAFPWFFGRGGFNAARSIVCVETSTFRLAFLVRTWCFNAARSIVCVETEKKE